MNELLSFTADQFRRDVRVQCAIHRLESTLPEIQRLLDATEEHIAKGSEHVIEVLKALDPEQFVRLARDGSYLILEQTSQITILESWTLARHVAQNLDKRLSRIVAEPIGIWLYDQHGEPLAAFETAAGPSCFHIDKAYQNRIVTLLASLTGLTAESIRSRIAPHHDRAVQEISIWRPYNARWNLYHLQVSCAQPG